MPVEIKKAGWPLEATVIIKSWVLAQITLLLLDHCHDQWTHYSRAIGLYCHDHHHNHQNADRGVIIKGRRRPGLTTSLRWAKLIISRRAVGGHTSFSHHLKSYQFILGWITVLAILAI